MSVCLIAKYAYKRNFYRESRNLLCNHTGNTGYFVVELCFNLWVKNDKLLATKFVPEAPPLLVRMIFLQT